MKKTRKSKLKYSSKFWKTKQAQFSTRTQKVCKITINAEKTGVTKKITKQQVLENKTSPIFHPNAKSLQNVN
ncbi:MAG: hypothetical protein E7064_08260 [Spirochaetaceae bacterium]|nr:hypothetical protein [Spirochaetaceae bacterium]